MRGKTKGLVLSILSLLLIICFAYPVNAESQTIINENEIIQKVEQENEKLDNKIKIDDVKDAIDSSVDNVIADANYEQSKNDNANHFGLITLLPPLIAIVLAFITKNVVLSLFIGALSGTFLLSLQGGNVFSAIIQSFLLFVEKVLGSLADPWNAGIILQVLSIGGLIALVGKMGGAKAVAESLSKKAKTQRSAQIITWFIGILIFFDDYANSLIAGPIMRPVTDKLKISREKLSFIIDATAAPIAGIVVISTWVGYELTLIKDAYESVDMVVNPFNLFIQTIPYRFYNILMLVFVVLTALLLREFGPMLKAERRARTTGKLLSDTAKPMVSEDTTDLEPKAGIKLRAMNALIPIGLLIVLSFVGFYYNGLQALDWQYPQDASFFEALGTIFGASDASIVIFQAALFSGIVAMFMGVFQKIFTLKEAVDTWVQGTKSLIITGVILLLAWTLSATIKDLGTAKFLQEYLSDKMPTFLLPSLIFVLGSIISFATGTSYGTMGILMPLAVPLAAGVSNYDPHFMIISCSAVLTGAILGDHCSPISDTTILSSMGAACDHVDHVSTQLPYALTIGAISILFGYIPSALGVPILIVLPVAILAVVLAMFIFGKPIVNNKKDNKVNA